MLETTKKIHVIVSMYSTNQKIEIRTGKNKQFDAYFAGRKLQVTEVREPDKLSSEDHEIQKKLDVLALADRLEMWQKLHV